MRPRKSAFLIPLAALAPRNDACPERSRTAKAWRAEGSVVRINIGIEDPQDLMADLAQALDKMKQAD